MPADRGPNDAKMCSTTDADISPEAFALIVHHMKALRDFNLDMYKDKCSKRRIAIRIRRTDCASAAQYAALLEQDEAEADHLLKVLTIHVSQFFRNPSTFSKLRDHVLPHLFSVAEATGRKRINIWSVGCAGGEEPYSVALLLMEHFGHLLGRRQVAILATDLDGEIIEAAKRGVYREERLTEVPEEGKQKWFAPVEGKFKLAQEIMDMVTFRQSDLSATVSYPASDLILCRNVLIYLERPYQEKILIGFADALSPGGMLVLGKAETLVGDSRRRFQTICPVERIYQLAG